MEAARSIRHVIGHAGNSRPNLFSRSNCVDETRPIGRLSRIFKVNRPDIGLCHPVRPGNIDGIAPVRPADGCDHLRQHLGHHQAAKIAGAVGLVQKKSGLDRPKAKTNVGPLPA